MKNKKPKSPLSFLIVVMLVIAYVVVQDGVSLVSLSTAQDIQDLEALHAASGEYHRPFIKVPLEDVFFTGYYLYLDNNEEIASDWLMCGYFDDYLVLFFEPDKADGKIPPEDYDYVIYTMRYPSKDNVDHMSWAYEAITDDLVNELGVPRSDVGMYLSPYVFQAAGSERSVVQLICLAAIVMLFLRILIYVVQLMRYNKMASEFPDLLPHDPDGGRFAGTNDGYDMSSGEKGYNDTSDKNILGTERVKPATEDKADHKNKKNGIDPWDF